MESRSALESAYSIWSTRLGAPTDFEEACTISGRIARTPPLGTMHSMAEVSLERRWMASYIKTPRRCDPGRTRREPLFDPDSSRWILTATTRPIGPSRRVGLVKAGLHRPRAPTRSFKALFEWERR